MGRKSFFHAIDSINGPKKGFSCDWLNQWAEKGFFMRLTRSMSRKSFFHAIDSINEPKKFFSCDWLNQWAEKGFFMRLTRSIAPPKKKRAKVSDKRLLFFGGSDLSMFFRSSTMIRLYLFFDSCREANCLCFRELPSMPIVRGDRPPPGFFVRPYFEPLYIFVAVKRSHTTRSHFIFNQNE